MLMVISDDLIYQKYFFFWYQYIVSYRIVETTSIFSINREIKKYLTILDIIGIFATDSLLCCMTGKKDYKCGELMVS